MDVRTVEDARKALEILEAHEAGKTIQVLSLIDKTWMDGIDLVFNCDLSEYRIKPEPREFTLIEGGSKLSRRVSGDSVSLGETIRVREILDDEE